MGKSKGKSGGGGGGKNSAATAASKCTCDHPFNCECGNRPPRPSRGHKWDSETQEWGGKGHKQKGGSGQTSMVGQEAKTTSVGKTSVAQWQRLPSQLLTEFCQKQRRPPPKFKETLQTGKSYKVRCIVPDQKDRDKDLFIVPKAAVGNEEQAKEDAALLALLQVTSNLPHERKLPEPYKTTWLTAVAAQNEAAAKAKQKTKATDKVSSNYNNHPNSTNNTTNDHNSAPSRQKGATANTNLALATTHVSSASRRQQQEQKKQIRNARIRRHEAIRMANRDHPVFLSAKLRLQIQRLLQGDAFLENPAEDDNDEQDPTLDEFSTDRQQCVEERLHQEGFTRRQARKAFEELSSQPVHMSDTDDEDRWDNLYDDCLQWLCVHLPENQLPEGFDPRGQTLEVVAPSAGKRGNTANANTKSSTSASGNSAGKGPAVSPLAKQLARRYGLSVADATWLLSQTKAQPDSTVENILWKAVCKLAEVATNGDVASSTSNSNSEENAQMREDEREALEAMFPEGLNISTDAGSTKINVPTPEGLTLTVTFDSNLYPSVAPNQVLCSDSGTAEGWVGPGVGVGFHVELAKFVATLPLGEPMLFELYSQMQVLQQTTDGLPQLTLAGETSSGFNTTTPTGGQKNASGKKSTGNSKSSKSSGKTSSSRPRLKSKRPRERGVFWSTHPSKTPPAVAFPKLSKSLELQRRGLPAGKAREDFLSILRKADKTSRVILVTGDTGCGKTTQIPQFILEEAPESAKIVVAQPRRLAATGVAARVADERGEKKPGIGSVGYVVRGDSAICRNTRLLFCTFGVLLRQLQCEGALDSITHIVIDEVHERNLDGDVLMALLKHCLDTTPNLRIVLMSATLDADRFAAYWGKVTPKMHIPGRTFPVEDYFLEDVLTMTGYNPPKKRKKKYFGGNNQQQPRQRKATAWDDSELSDKEDDEEEPQDKDLGDIAKTHQYQVPLEERVKRVDESNIDYDMLGQLVKHLVREEKVGAEGSILVFLPGAPEINQAKTVIEKITGGLPIQLLPLHGGLQPREQNIVFRPSPNATKVILSTNVAETSITIPDCTVVIDGCREKQSAYDPTNRMPLLIEVFASKASLKQRRGRAGRVRSGKCYKLISKATHEKLHDHTAPEITRCALDQTLLSLLFLGVEHGSGVFLRTFLDPPKQESVDAASYSLWKIGALEKELDEMRLTPLGMHLAGIPAPPVVGKMLVMGSILGCRRASLAMAAGISTGRSPFLRVDVPRNKRVDEESMQEMKQRHVLEERSKLFEQAGNSDHVMLAAAFMKWENSPTGGGDRKTFCEKLGLSFTGMRDILQLVNQYDSALSNAGYGRSKDSDRNAKSWRVLRTCAISAMAPSQLVRVHRPATKYASTAEGALEKDGVAKELKFFIRQEGTDQSSGQNMKDERVFIHPSSALFSVGNYNCPWLVYHSMVKTSKPFLRDATECSAYALLLFGGQLEVEARNGVITVDGWVKLSANARIGALIRGLRGKMDDLLAEKIKYPNIDISDTPEMKLIVSLLSTDGLGS